MSRNAAQIAREAQSLLEEVGIDQAPVDVRHVAHHLGIRIEQAAYEGDVSGFLLQDRTRTVMGLNAAHSPARRRFTTAHEIGHFVLHRAETPTTFVDHAPSRLLRRDARSALGTDRLEIEANAFAAELLMPRTFLERDIEALQQGDADSMLVALARQYGVSVQAITLRLERLGFLQDVVL